MKRKHLLPNLGLLLVFAVSLILVLPQDALAQDKKEKERVVVRSKVKKGDGSDVEKEVKVEIKDGRIFVNGEEVSKEELEEMEDINVFWTDRDDMEKEHVFRLRSDLEGKKMMELHSQMAPMMERARDLTSRNKAFAVFGDASPAFFGGETMKMDMASRELAMKIRTMDGDTAELEAELDKMLDDIFAEKQAGYMEQVDALREKLATLEQKVHERESNKAEIVDRRKKELLGKANKWDW